VGGYTLIDLSMKPHGIVVRGSADAWERSSRRHNVCPTLACYVPEPQIYRTDPLLFYTPLWGEGGKELPVE